jgi:hypothetical protein
MRDPELVARAQRAATRLESAWEQWRALHGLADAPGQPVVSYVGYSLKEPWGEPRVVIGIDADEAEYLAEFLDRDECVQRGQVPGQQGQLQQGQLQPPALSPGQLQPVPLQAGPLQSGPLQQARDIAAELVGWNPGELPGQLPEQFASWPPGGPLAADQPPASA